MMRMLEDRSSDSPTKCPCQSQKNRLAVKTPQKPAFAGASGAGQCEECEAKHTDIQRQNIQGPGLMKPAASAAGAGSNSKGAPGLGHDFSNVRLFSEREAAKHDTRSAAPRHTLRITLPVPAIETHLFDDHSKKPQKQEPTAGHHEKTAAPEKTASPSDAPKTVVTTTWSDCAPKPADAAQLDAIKPHIFGHTGLGSVTPIDFDIHFQNNNCWTQIKTSPSFALKDFIYAKEGDYPREPETADHSPCKGKQQNVLVHINPAVSDRVAQGEIEHCNDIHRAFNLTFDRAYASASVLQMPFHADDVPDCQTKIMSKLQDLSGFDISKVADKFLCLFKTSKTRDDSGWHTLVWGQPETAIYSKDCKTVTYTPRVGNVLPELGKHTTENVVSGCGVKP